MSTRTIQSLCRYLLLAFAAMCMGPRAGAAEAPGAGRYHHAADVIYGRKFGVALTMDVFRPSSDANRTAVILVVSGGWVSSHEGILPFIPLTELLLTRGFTVFTVVHGSQPKFTIPEILLDMHRAVRYIRYHAAAYEIDPDRIGMAGASAGGHLSLMQGVAGDPGDPRAADPVDRVSSRVQAVACFFPPTDFLNYGITGRTVVGTGVLKAFAAPFDFFEFLPKEGVAGRFVRVTEESKVLEIARAISPITHVNAGDAPALIIHGDADVLVPIQQSQVMMAAYKKAGVPSRLIVKAGGGHGWPGMEDDARSIADWLDRYLRPITKTPAPLGQDRQPSP